MFAVSHTDEMSCYSSEPSEPYVESFLKLGEEDYQPPYINNLTKKTILINFKQLDNGTIPIHYWAPYGPTIAVGDCNNDGFEDVWVGSSFDREGWETGFFGSTGQTFLLQNDGTGEFQDITLESGLKFTNSTYLGASWADYDNDGDLDIYVANGHLSGNSALDYCTRFWCHDVYTGTSKPNKNLETFFSGKLSGLGSNYSWNGFEHNHLFLSNNKNGFNNVAFLFGTAFEFDSRAVIAADIDVDGLNDLLVVQYDANAKQQRLFVMGNQLSTKSKWIGLNINDAPGVPTNGATVKLFTKTQSFIKQFVTGDSFTAQHPSTAHFGLGENDFVEKVEVHWPNGKKITLNQPAIGKYHQITP